METLQGHYHQWGAVAFFTILYGLALLFIPFNHKMQKKPATAYLAFVVAFALEMHGIPFGMYLIGMVVGHYLKEGVLWGHTLIDTIGYVGMYINILFAAIGFSLIINGWYHIYHEYWSKKSGAGKVVKTGVYRFIRHPQYTGFIMITLGMIFGCATLPTLLLFPLIVYLYIRLAKKEENAMVEEFGEEYLMYMRRTKRFIPFLF